MKNSLVFLMIAISIMLNPPIVFSSDNKTMEQDTSIPMYYWQKGNRGEKLSRKEFKILMLELEKSLTAFKVASSKISIAEANFSYETGKGWEIQLDFMKEKIETALDFIKLVKNNPNSMALSLGLYVSLIEIKSLAYDFDRIEEFEKTLNGKHINLSFWCRAFQEAYLFQLAIEKDSRKP